ncbi:MAG: formylglycine-generating enzyme family protein [Planctomycetia bacterium]|nr:formylglycine-generating enzyme family protein [Planctomycetia bacterium]
MRFRFTEFRNDSESALTARLTPPARLVLLAALFLPAAARADDKLPLGLVQEKPPQGRYVETQRGFMVPYKAAIPGSEVTFEMQPVPGGKFLLGSPDAEPDRGDDEGPQVEIEIEPFWIGAYEITWAEYKQYMAMHDIFKKLHERKLHAITRDNEADVVTAPSNLYDPSFTFQFGDDPRQPAITMSQFAAKQYTKWLSGITRDFYRLPTEAEWEYACRAGTTTAFSFGDDAAKLGDFAWFVDNSNEKTHKVGMKKPNAWGLFDMHGNAAEWVLDEFTADGYKRLAGKPHKASGAVDWPKKLFPRVVRGGAWDEEAPRLRSAARCPSDDDDWRAEDPNFPNSPWWFTSGHGLAVGFRIIRPLEAPPAKDRAKYHDADIEDIVADTKQRIDNEGRGARGVANPELLKAIEGLKKE